MDQGPQCITLSALKGRRHKLIMIWTFESEVSNTEIKIYLTSL